MYLTKSPTCRIDESDLKCKNGCDYYGNAAWQGYCSVCHREQQKALQEREQKIREQQQQSESTHQFERQQQDKSKSKLAAFSRLRKLPTKGPDPKQLLRELCINNVDILKVEAENRDLIVIFNKTPVARDVSKRINYFVSEVLENKDCKKIERLSDITQTFYQNFQKRMEEHILYKGLCKCCE